MNNKPYPITEAEWHEIVSMPAVRELWGLGDDADPLEFASQVYGARFYFVSGSPGYVGDLYVLQGDSITEVPPLKLMRDRTGHLTVC